MRLVLGSINPDKIRIVKNALGELHIDVDVVGTKVDSGITSQPLDREITKRGAINRARNAKKLSSGADLWIGLEAGLHDYGEGYHLVTFACLIDKGGKKFFGSGTEIHLPEKVSDEVKKGKKFGEAIRLYAKEYEIDVNLISRNTSFTEAIQSAYGEYIRASLSYRKKAAGVIIDKNENYLIVQLVGYGPDHWNFSGGGIEEGETDEEALARELFEELGTKKFEILARAETIEKYEWPSWLIARDLKTKDKFYRGQEVRYFLVKFIGNSGDIKPDPGEIRRVKWVKYNELPEHLVMASQWKVAKKVIKELGRS